MEMNGFFSLKRLAIIGSCMAAVFLAVVFSYGRYMLATPADAGITEIAPERGSILDRNGKLLAVQTTLYNIAITRSAIPDKALFANLLSPPTGIPEDELKARLMDDNSGNFFYLQKKISENEKTAISAVISQAKLRGIRLEPVMSRTYPENQLASSVIGFLGDDGEGLTGVEYSFQDLLSPPDTSPGKKAGPYNVMLTIDGNIQYELEKIARTTMDDTKAESLMMIAADAKTGEILAYVSEPSANLNTYGQSSEEARNDRPALYAYEPGSVFKIFSISSFLELGAVQDGDRFLCDGAYTYTTPLGEKFTITDLGKYGWLTPRDIIRLSSNVGTAQIAIKADDGLFEQKLRAFGFGLKTGIELPGETAGIFRPHDTWSLRSRSDRKSAFPRSRWWKPQPPSRTREPGSS
jgi:cell division protein FtsI (penicillin-binding protein 3)